MMKRYAILLNKSIRIVIIPFLTPRLSSYWVDLITPVKASLARPLIDSLKHEATVGDNSIHKIVPIKLKKFEDAVKSAMNEQVRKNSIIRKERTVVPEQQDITDIFDSIIRTWFDVLFSRCKKRNIPN